MQFGEFVECRFGEFEFWIVNTVHPKANDDLIVEQAGGGGSTTADAARACDYGVSIRTEWVFSL